MKSPFREPKLEPKLEPKRSTPQLEDPAARVKRLTELLQNRIRQELRQTGGSGALDFWLRSD